MRLPRTIQELEKCNLGRDVLVTAIHERRRVIRVEHRDQCGDDRCFLDDYRVWAMVEGLPSGPPPMTREEGMSQCRLFFMYRRALEPDPIPEDAILDHRLWDDDLLTVSHGDALKKLADIQQAIFVHFDISDCWRDIDDDRRLYAVLPEKVPADFRLPPESEFLGRSKDPRRSCPNFWDSHACCPSAACNLHQWGPCKP